MTACFRIAAVPAASAKAGKMPALRRGLSLYFANLVIMSTPAARQHGKFLIVTRRALADLWYLTATPLLLCISRVDRAITEEKMPPISPREMVPGTCEKIGFTDFSTAHFQ